MNEGRDLDDLGEQAALHVGGWAPWQARWFRATVVFSVAAMTAALAVPYVLNRAAPRTVGGPVPVPQARPGAVIPDASTLAREGRPQNTGQPIPSAGLAAMPDMRVLVIRPVSATAPLAPKRAESGIAKGSTASKTPPERSTGAESGELYWVQVGAYRDVEMAKRVAQRLREHKYQVRESIAPRPAPSRTTADVAPVAQGERDRYEIVVTGSSASEVEAKLRTKGLTSRAAAEGSVITPGLPLGEAVSLAKDLADEGLSVRVRRVSASAAAAPRVESNAATETLHRVRVGGFADRAAAMATLKELEARGYKPFLTRGNE